MKKHNDNCDGDHCTAGTEKGEVRRLPIGGNSAAILCRACYEHEMAWRRERNQEMAKDCAFDLPAWEALKVYPEPEARLPGKTWGDGRIDWQRNTPGAATGRI